MDESDLEYKTLSDVNIDKNKAEKDLSENPQDERYSFYKPEKQRSKVWDEFDLIKYQGKSQNLSRCVSCKEIFTYCTKTGTGSMLRHKCSSKNEKEKQQSSNITKRGSKAMPADNVKKKLIEKQSKFTTDDIRPLSVTEGFSTMTSPQSVTQICLSWDNYLGNMSSSLNSLLENQELMDVTFAVEGKFLKAHRFVLSVCSPYFKSLFKDCLPFHQPVIFMKDISYDTMNDLLKFMYQGEARIDQEHLTSFLQAAEALQIKGLWVDNSSAGNIKAPSAEKQNITSLRTEKKQTSTVNTKPTNRRLSSSNADIRSKRIKLVDEASSLDVDHLSEKDIYLQIKMDVDDKEKDVVATISDNVDPLGDNLEDEHQEKENDSDNTDDNECDGRIDDSIDNLLKEGQGTIYFRKGQKRPVMVLGQYEYKVERQFTSTRVSWCCIGKTKYKCKARALTYNDNLVLKCREHNHWPTFKGNCTVEPKTVNISSSYERETL